MCVIYVLCELCVLRERKSGLSPSTPRAKGFYCICYFLHVRIYPIFRVTTCDAKKIPFIAFRFPARMAVYRTRKDTRIIVFRRTLSLSLLLPALRNRLHFTRRSRLTDTFQVLAQILRREALVLRDDFLRRALEEDAAADFAALGTEVYLIQSINKALSLAIGSIS